MAASAVSENNKSVFFPPAEDPIYADTDYSIKPSPHSTVDQLIASIAQNGPLVAVGRIGPTAYSEAPKESKHKMEGRSVYYWRSDAFQESAPHKPHLLIGADKTKVPPYVYFVRADDTTPKAESPIRSFKQLATDKKIYFMTYDNLVKRLFNLHPICPHAKWLYFTPLRSFLDKENEGKRCKEIGQEIFDLYKTRERTGDRDEKTKSALAKDALRRICEASTILGDGERGRKRMIESVWDGVGDKNERWYG